MGEHRGYLESEQDYQRRMRDARLRQRLAYDAKRARDQAKYRWLREFGDLQLEAAVNSEAATREDWDRRRAIPDPDEVESAHDDLRRAVRQVAEARKDRDEINRIVDLLPGNLNECEQLARRFADRARARGVPSAPPEPNETADLVARVLLAAAIIIILILLVLVGRAM